jgi:opacity protein-like surface antigen
MGGHNEPFKEGFMKRMMWAVALCAGMSSAAFAEGETPVIDQRQANQERRIDQGIASGQLNQREANRLEREQHRIDRMENRSKTDGVVTDKERARIGAAQNRASRHIARQKHDRQSARR